MRQKTFNVAAGVIFLWVLVLHGARILYGWPAELAGVAMPIWVSYLAVVVAALMTWVAFSKKR